MRKIAAVLLALCSVTAFASRQNIRKVQITISPTSATVQPGAQQQFTATVTGTSNTSVNWSVITGTGTITNTGLYSSPPISCQGETDSVRVMSVANPNKVATATVTVPPSASKAHTVALSWTDPDQVTFTVYRSTVNGGFYGQIASGLTSPTFTDNSVSSNTTYYYVVTATANNLESGFSNQAPAPVPCP